MLFEFQKSERGVGGLSGGDVSRAEFGCFSSPSAPQNTQIRSNHILHHIFLRKVSPIIDDCTNKNEEKQNLCLHFPFSCAIIPLAVADVAVRDPGVAQLVARLTGGQEAVSSSLATRTK